MPIEPIAAEVRSGPVVPAAARRRRSGAFRRSANVGCLGRCDHVGGKESAEWHRRLTEHVLKLQQPDGSWVRPSDGTGLGPAYQTSLAVIILSVPTRNLPMLRRQPGAGD